MGKMILILVMGSILIFGLVNYNINSKINDSSEEAINNYSLIQVRNICNSTAQILIAKLGDTPSYRTTSPTSIKLFDGTATYTVEDTYMDGDSLIKLNIAGTYNSVNKTVTVYVNKNTDGKSFIPAAVLAAISTNNDVTTLGSLIVDGRDHELDGSVIGGAGTLAIWTTGSYSRSGNSKLGATVDETDYAPTKKNISNLYQDNGEYPNGYPETPDLVLGGDKNGFSEGTLKKVAVSGTNGSQYVTDPSDLNYPLACVTYVELPSGRVWNPANVEGTGILILHNSSTNAEIKNINSGTFKGLLIAADMVHIHTDIIGAVVCLSPTPSEGNCIGNENGNVLYSSTAIKKGISDASSSNAPGYGFANHRMGIKYWYE